MSDLVEKVTAAINGGFTESDHAKEKARLAIKAVAEWMVEAGCDYGWVVAEQIRVKLEGSE